MNVLQERIAKLKAHLKRRGRRRDFQAMFRLAELQGQLAQRRTSSDTFDLLLKNIYTTDLCRPDRMYLFDANPFFSILKKEKP